VCVRRNSLIVQAVEESDSSSSSKGPEADRKAASVPAQSDAVACAGPSSDVAEPRPSASNKINGDDSDSAADPTESADPLDESAKFVSALTRSSHCDSTHEWFRFFQEPV
jgi:hypothetical protein